MRLELTRHDELQRFIDSLPCPAGVLRSGYFAYANTAFTKLLAYPSPGQLTGKHISEVFSAQSPGKAGETAGLAPGFVLREQGICRSDGAVIYAHVLAQGLPASGKESETLVVLQDVSEYAGLKRELERQDFFKAAGMTAAATAHDLATPLTAILTSLELLSEQWAKASRSISEARGESGFHKAELEKRMSDAGKLISRARESCGYARGLIQKLRLVAAPRATSGGAVLDKIARFATSALAHELREGIELIEDYRPCPKTGADEDELRQVAINLVLNAIQAVRSSKSGKWVQIGTWTDAEGRAVLEVRDSGPGIPESEQARVFEPFVTTGASSGGMGLGLYICRTLVSRNGGSLELDSELGKGTRFTVRLPAREAAATVLVMDEQADLLGVLEEILSERYRVKTAATIREAVAAAEADPAIDCVVLDLTLEDGFAPEALAALSRLGKGLEKRALLMTGGPLDNATRKFIDGFRNPVLEKPFNKDQLLRAVESLILKNKGEADTLAPR